MDLAKHGSSLLKSLTVSSSTIIRATNKSGLRNGDLKCLKVGTLAHFVPLISDHL